MKLVNIKNEYIQYLQNFSDNVKYNKDENRPYIGILLKIDNHNYFAPLGSPKPKHLKMKSNLDFIKIKKGELGIINLNNMIPVPDKFIKDISLANKDKKYRKLLIEQERWIIRNKEIIIKKSEKLYKLITEKENTIWHKRCNNFKLLENKALEWEKRKLIEKKANYNCLTGNPIEIENHTSGETKWISKTDVMKHKVEIKPDAKAIQINVVHIEEKKLYMKPVSYYNISELCITKDLEQRFKPRKEKVQQKIKEKDRGMER